MASVELNSLSDDMESNHDAQQAHGAGLLQGAGYERVPGVVDDDDGDTGGPVQTEWSGTRDVDQLLKDVYTFYSGHGFGNVVIGRICTLLNLGFTIVASSVALGFMDWAGITECANAADCKGLFAYIHWKGLLRPATPWQAVVWFYAVALALYWARQLLLLPPFVLRMFRVRSLFVYRLGLPVYDMQCTSWDKVLKRLEILNRTYRLHSHVEHMTALDMTCRIMREDNYMIALVNSDNPADGEAPIDESARAGPLTRAPRGFVDGAWQLDLSAPFFLRALFPRGRVFTRHIELNLRMAVLNPMFKTHRNEKLLDPKFTTSPARLRLRLVVLAAANLALTPALLIYRLVRFVFEHAEGIKSRKLTIFQRRWTDYAIWRFRQINEVSHYLDERMRASVKPASEYEQQFPAPVTTTLARSASYLTAACIALLLPLYLVDENILVHLSIGDRSLLSVMLVLFSVLGTAQSMLPSQSSVLRPQQTLEEVLKHTHYGPREWRERGNRYTVRDTFLEYRPPLIRKFVAEVASVLLTPYLLLALVRQAPAILHFVRSNTVELYQVGDVLRESTLEPKHLTEENIDTLRSSRLGQGIAYFSMKHPHWRPTVGAGAIVRRTAQTRIDARDRGHGSGTGESSSSVSSSGSTPMSTPDDPELVDAHENEVDVSEAAAILAESDTKASARPGDLEGSFYSSVRAKPVAARV